MDTQGQMNIREDLMVHAKGADAMGGAAGVHVGSVDKVEGRFIKLNRKDANDGKHHWIPMDWVERTDDRAVYLSKTAEEFEAQRFDERPLH